MAIKSGPIDGAYLGEQGSFSGSSLLYHRSIPSTIERVRVWQLSDCSTTPNHPLTPRHLRMHDLFKRGLSGIDVVTGRRLVLGNADVRLSYVVADAVSPFYRNGIGDECVYIERGGARVETVFGAFDLARGDYLVIPRSTTHRWLPPVAGDQGFAEPLRAYCIEAASHIGPPKRYLSKFGQLLEHAPYCERDLCGPNGPLVTEDIGAAPAQSTEVYLKHRGSGAAATGGLIGKIHNVPFHPLDVVGWGGACIRTHSTAGLRTDHRAVHQPPPVHQVFEAGGFVVCNFGPRKVDYHPDSIPVPYYHSNVDSDEIMFYVDGDYEAR